MTASSQVGINIQNPQGIFHIDAQNNNPVSVADDVLVDGNGNVGLGILSPTAKLDINVLTGSTALRIEDGTQAEGRILMSDANGNTSWGVIKGSGGYSFSITQKVTFPHTISSVVPLDGTNTYIPITSKGNYLLTIRWWGKTSGTYLNAVSAYFNLFKNGSMVDGIEYYAPTAANIPFTFTTVLMATNCNSGDQLEIKIIPSSGGQPWIINDTGMIPPSISVFRM